jgi:hypothetical protein
MTRKEITNNFSKVFSIGYGDMQYLLRYQNRIGYNSGIYGWNFDVYVVNGIAICTGYRNTPGQRIDYDILKKYEKKAEKIAKDYTLDYDKTKRKINNLLYKLMEELQQ